MAIDNTPKSPTGDGYSSVAEADTYFGNRLYVDVWTTASTSNKEKGIKWATQILDQAFEWQGTPTTQTQRLRWPRSGVYTADMVYINPDTYPELLKQATAEFAMELLNKNRPAESELLGLGISDVTLGSLSVTMDNADSFNLIPQMIVLMLEPFGTPKTGTSSGGGVVKLRRV